MFTFRSILLALSVICCTTIVTAQEAQPPATVAGLPPLKHLIDKHEAVTFGPHGCPVFLLGNRVWHWKRDEQVQTLDVELKESMHRRLSHNGQWFVHAVKTHNQDETAIRVWNCVTGEMQCEIPGRTDYIPDYIEVVLNKYVILGSRGSNELETWEIASGKLLKTIDTKLRSIRQGDVAFNADASFYTDVDDDRLFAFKTKDSRPVVEMAAPQEREFGGVALQVEKNKVVRDTRRGSAQASFVYSFSKWKAFSPDDKELAIISSFPDERLIVWDQRGQIVFDEPYEKLKGQHGDELQWLPDRSGWWIGDQFFDRESKKIVFIVERPFFRDRLIHPVSRTQVNTILESSINNTQRTVTLETVELPWDKAQDPSATLPIVLE